MLTTIIISCVILLSILTYYFFILKPKQIINFYKTQFTKLGFKVFDYPFQAFKAAEFQTGLKGQQKSRDAMSFTKEVTSQFDVSIVNLANKVQINLISPKLMQAFFQSDQQKYYQKDQFFVSGLRRAFGNGITLVNGNIWKHKRKVVTKMLNFSYIKLLVPKIESIIERKAKELHATINKQNDQNYHEFDMLDLTTTIASTVMLQLFFGGSKFDVSDLKINGMQINYFVRYMFELLLRQLLSPWTAILGNNFTKLGIRKNDRELNHCIESFHNFTKEYILKRVEQLNEHYKEEKEGLEYYTDLIEAFYYQQIVKNKQEVTADFIYNLISDFGLLYVAGTDTTSHNSQVTLYYIISHPQVLAKLREELSKNIKNIKDLTYDDLKNCPYLEAVVMESLRMYSTANGIFPRVAKEDHYLKLGQSNVLITKGTIINTQTFSVHYKEQIYNEPHKFKPERYLDAEGKPLSPQPYTWMNFSAGYRSCVGKQLALTEMKTILITLLSLYDFKCVDSDKLLYYKQFSYSLANVKFQIKAREGMPTQ